MSAATLEAAALKIHILGSASRRERLKTLQRQKQEACAEPKNVKKDQFDVEF